MSQNIAILTDTATAMISLLFPLEIMVLKFRADVQVIP